MKITAIESFVLRVPTARPMALEFPFHALVGATVATDEGVTGLGYTLAFGTGGAEAIRVYLESRLKPLLLGEDPRLVERHWERMYRADRGIRRVGLAAYALSVLDIALWDIVGKVAGQPLARLWGAATDRVAAYGSGGWARYTVDDLVEEARRYVAQGCRHYKLKVHDPDPRVNLQRLEAVRLALGADVGLMVDVNQRLDVHGAIRLAQMLEDLDLVWFEEPVLADDIAGCAEVARAIRIPVATGENHHTRYEFRDLLERRAARYLMPDVGRANGFTETLRIGRLASAYPVAISPHVVHELSLHVAAALPNAFLVEYMEWGPRDLFEEWPRCEAGAFVVPERPGHGMVLAPDARRKYAT
ncbi:MAG TPA: mandelate racemase/muconate lactonizing enzyme family protein [Candidatus Tectomicrobia bacterium]|nr:mandelate racemase/muconate lactonizing enzyme family protein [Candidatus Tectomicrobia bacterium]